jgi:WD40 repeat protein
LVRCVPAHEGEVLILKKQRERLLSGGKDGKIKCWIYAEQLTPESATELALLSELLKVVCWPISIDVKLDKNLLIGSSKGHIVEIYQGNETILVDEPTDEIFDFVIDHNNLTLVTTSADLTIRKWCLKTNTLLLKTPTKRLITALDILVEKTEHCYICADKGGEIFKLGPNFQEKNIKCQSMFKQSELIRIMSISPNGKILAVCAANAAPKVELIIPGGINGKLTKLIAVQVNFAGKISKLDWSKQSMKRYDRDHNAGGSKKTASKNASCVSFDKSMNASAFGVPLGKWNDDHDFIILNSTFEEMGFIS